MRISDWSSDVCSSDLRHLSAFMAALEQGRIAGASRRIRRSSSAIARSIGILEQELGRPLLARSQRGLAPTAEGALVAARCQIIGEGLRSGETRLGKECVRKCGCRWFPSY